MSKDTKAAQAAENTEKEKTVTISEAQLNSMLADITLMKEKLASEERQRGAVDAKRLRAEAERKRLEEANARSMELVEYHVEMGSLKSSKNVEVAINGRQYVIPRGVTVKIPRCVAEVLDNARRQLNLAYGVQEEKVEELEQSVRQFAPEYA